MDNSPFPYSSDEERANEKWEDTETIVFIEEEPVRVSPHLYIFADEAEKTFHSYIENHHQNNKTFHVCIANWIKYHSFGNAGISVYVTAYLESIRDNEVTMAKLNNWVLHRFWGAPFAKSEYLLSITEIHFIEPYATKYPHAEHVVEEPLYDYRIETFLEDTYRRTPEKFQNRKVNGKWVFPTPPKYFLTPIEEDYYHAWQSKYNK